MTTTRSHLRKLEKEELIKPVNKISRSMTVVNSGLSDICSHSAYRILVPWLGIEPGPRLWKHSILSTGPLGNSLSLPSFEMGELKREELSLSDSVWLSTISVHFPHCGSLCLWKVLPLALPNFWNQAPWCLSGALGSAYCFSGSYHSGASIRKWVLMSSHWLPITHP